MMNTKEAAKSWKIRKVEALRFCKEGMVPTADKIKSGILEDYDIPENTPKPPCHRRSAVLMLENIDLIKAEDANPWVRGYSYETIIDCYNYFEDCGFLAGFVKPEVENMGTLEKREALRCALKGCSVTMRGEALINAERNEPEKDRLIVTKVNAGGKIEAGPVEAHIDAELSRAY